MTILVGVYTFAAADSGITALVGTRIRPGRAHSSDALPYLLYNLISDEAEYHFGGRTGLARARIQFDCIGDNEDSADAVADAVDTAFSGYRGDMGTFAVRRCHRSSRVGPFSQDPVSGEQTDRFRVRADYSIHYFE